MVDRAPVGGLAQRGHRWSASSGREVGGRPVRVQAEADDDPRIVAAQTRRLAQDAGQLADLGRDLRCERHGARRRVSITRSLGHLSRIAPSGRPATSSAASAIASEIVAARRQTRSAASHVGPEARATAAGPRPPGPSTSGRPGHDPRTARRRPRGRPPASRRPASRGRRRWSNRRRRSAPGGRGTRSCGAVGGRLSRPPRRRPRRPRAVRVVPARRPRGARAGPSPAPPRRSCR